MCDAQQSSVSAHWERFKNSDSNHFIYSRHHSLFVSHRGLPKHHTHLCLTKVDSFLPFDKIQII